MPRALILGGTGVLGRAAASRLLDEGWDVEVTGREAQRMPPELSARGALFTASDRASAGDLRAVIGEGADLLVDCVCFSDDDARLLLPRLGDVASTVMLSSKAVYVDEQGRHANSLDRPVFDAPVRETNPTVAPGRGDPTSREGYGANKVAAENTLLDSGAPVTVLRLGKVHGVGASRPREWVFVKRVLDGRDWVLLADRGERVDHTTAAANAAALISTVARAPGSRILNSGDPVAPRTLDIARTVATHLGHEWEEVLLDPDVDLGATPWDGSIQLDLSAATALGYVQAGSFAETVTAELDWLLELADRGEAPNDPFFDRYLQYPPEDAYLLRRQLGYA
jgi:nucleoside-diphosphate-sugar epimerase